MRTKLPPNYGKFGSGSRGPEGLHIGHYAKHEIWVRWLTAFDALDAKEKENERLREALTKIVAFEAGLVANAYGQSESYRIAQDALARLDAADDKETT